MADLQSAASTPQTPSRAKVSGNTPPRPHRAPTKTSALDPDLARLIDAWPTLPDPIKAAVLALLDSARPSLKGDSHNSHNSPGG